jgi:chromosome segregation ATPase
MSNSNDDLRLQALQNMRNDVTEIQKQLATQEVLISRFDTALDKISEVSLNVSKLLAVHEQRLEASEEKTKELPQLIEARFQESNKRFDVVHDRITSVETGMRNELGTMQKEILSELKGVREDMTNLGNDLKEDVDEKIDTVNTRVTKLERLSWIVVGGATVIGFILSQALGVIHLFTGS